MLICEHLKKTYQKKCVVDDLSFSVSTGEAFALLGSNGAGKTTAIKMPTSRKNNRMKRRRIGCCWRFPMISRRRLLPLRAAPMPWSGELSRYYRMIDQKAGRVNTLVNELFLLLKMEDGDYRMQYERTDLGEMTRQICAEYYEDITGRGLDFQIQIPELPVYAQADRKEFSRVIENLLENAAKYNQTGKIVGVEVGKTSGGARICVWDDGEAVAEELQPVLFDPFVRGDLARQTSGGTGLGLSIAGKIAEKHKGGLQYVRQEEKNIFIVSLNEK